MLEWGIPFLISPVGLGEAAMRWVLTCLYLAVFGLVTLADGTDGPRTKAAESPGPRPGDLYREYSFHSGGDRDWRITDVEAVKKFERARNHLPNSVLPLRVDDLEHAVRAEAVLDRWGGHRGTINKRIRFNGNAWISIPEITDLPNGIRGEQLMYQDNPVIAVPLDHLVEGDNTFEGNCDESGGFGWGQWGLYALTLRVYYDPALKTNHEVDARITSPLSGRTIKDNPGIAISASAKVGVSRIDVLARYNGYDEDGDGRHGGFHESRFQLVNGGDNEVRDHVGTLWSEPHRLVWQTRYVPDQPAGSVALVARVQDSRGYWSVSPIVDGLTLDRANVSVRTYRATGVPEDFSVRVGETKSCMIRIPEDADLQSAASAVLHLRTWHGWDGHHDPIKINDHA
ncbi:MAG: hypothetical protein AAF802_29455, partial [Planctomycetota bacterium]